MLRAQLRHLSDVVERYPETVDLRVVLFTAREFAALGASTFHMFDFPSTRLPVLLYQENVTSAEIIDRPSTVHEYAVAHHDTRRSALSREDTLIAIREAEREL